jgi:hypothetical protein
MPEPSEQGKGRLRGPFKLLPLTYPEAHTGFEPVSPDNPVPSPLLRKLEELKARGPKGSRDGTR